MGGSRTEVASLEPTSLIVSLKGKEWNTKGAKGNRRGLTRTRAAASLKPASHSG